MELLSTLFLQTAQGNLPTVVTIPVFSLLVIVFVLIFTLNPCNSNAAFQASNLPFRASNISLISSHRHKTVIPNILT